MEKIITATGKEFKCDLFSVISEPPRCYISISGISMSKALSVFSDRAETSCIKYGDNVVTGFNEVQAVSQNDNAIMVTLKKG